MSATGAKPAIAPIAAEIPGLVNYTVSIADVPAESRYDGIAQLYFDSADALEAGFDSKAMDETAADPANFANGEDVLRFVVEEGVVVDET